MAIYQVTDWADHFEVNRSRELKTMKWVPVPNKFDGDGYTELVDHENGAAHLGAWLTVIQIASKCDPRGVLLREGNRPHDAGSLARMSRLPKATFDEALPRLVAIGWLEMVESQEGAGFARECAPIRQDITGQDITGENSAKRAGSLIPVQILAELQADPSWESVDVTRTYERMKADAKRRKKTPSRVRLNRWLEFERDLIALLPAWFSLELAHEWLEHRLSLKKPVTLSMLEKQIRMLEKWHGEHGQDPVETINRSIANGWLGLFERGNGNGHKTNGTAQAGGGQSRGKPSRVGVIRSRDYSVFATGKDPSSGPGSESGTDRDDAGQVAGKSGLSAA